MVKYCDVPKLTNFSNSQMKEKEEPIMWLVHFSCVNATSIESENFSGQSEYCIIRKCLEFK